MHEWWRRWWLAAAVIPLVVASEYRLRLRPPDEALAGTLDRAVAVELLTFAAVGGLLAVIARPPRQLVRSPSMLWAAGWVAFLALSALWAPNPLYSGVRSFQMVVILLVALTAARGDEEPFHRLALAYASLTAASVVYGVAVPAVPASPLQEGRFTWLAVHPVPAAVLLGVSVVLTASYLAVGPHAGGRVAPSWLYAILLALNLGGLIGTSTRGGIIGAAVATLLLAILVPTGRRRVALISLLVPTLLVLTLLAGPLLLRYLSRGESTERLATLNSRTLLWELALRSAAQEPLFGHGVGASRSLFYEDTGLGGGHNALINVAVDTGLVGVVLWLGLVLSIASSIAPIRRTRSVMTPVTRVPTGDAVVAAVVCFLMVNGLVHQGAGDVVNSASTWLLVCAAWATVLRAARTTPVSLDGGLRTGPGTRSR